MSGAAVYCILADLASEAMMRTWTIRPEADTRAMISCHRSCRKSASMLGGSVHTRAIPVGGGSSCSGWSTSKLGSTASSNCMPYATQERLWMEQMTRQLAVRLTWPTAEHQPTGVSCVNRNRSPKKS